MSAAGDPHTGLQFRWAAIVAGAIGAAGVSFTLHAFAAGIGLSLVSIAPTWRDSSPWLWLLSGIYLVFVSLAAFGFGGYISARLQPVTPITAVETEFRDGIMGLISWALAILLTAVLALGAAATVSPATAPGGALGAFQSVAGENIIASELDDLFRGSHDVASLMYHRAEAARILLKANGHSGISNEDRRSLGVIAARATGESGAGVEDRTERAIANSTTELRRARTAAVLQAFFIGAALLIGAAVSWFAATEGGRDREEQAVPLWNWSWKRSAR
jgi:hypothetical protein